MPRKPNPIPTLLQHRATGRAFVRVDGREVYFGRWGTTESLAAYRRFVAEHLAGVERVSDHARPARVGGTEPLSIAGLIARFWRHVEATGRYLKRGKPTTERNSLHEALDELLVLYGPTPAAEFGPRRLIAFRDSIMSGPRGMRSRSTVNARVKRVVRVFRWAVARELLPASVAHGLACVPGLRRGETDRVREPRRVMPADPEHVEKAIAAAPPTIATMLRLQRFTGMRPCEVCTLRPVDIDRSAVVWLYRPADHKTAHHDVDRVIPLGPKARAVLAPFLDGCAAESFCFTPDRADEERRAAQRRAAMQRYAGRARPNRRRDAERAANPRRVFRERFDAATYRRAIDWACKAAGVPEFAPNRVRHLYATEARARAGLDVAQALLGHTAAVTTERYAERNNPAAIAYARKHG